MNQNILRLRHYQNKKLFLETLDADYPRPLLVNEQYETWRAKQVEPPQRRFIDLILQFIP